MIIHESTYKHAMTMIGRKSTTFQWMATYGNGDEAVMVESLDEDEWRVANSSPSKKIDRRFVTLTNVGRSVGVFKLHLRDTCTYAQSVSNMIFFELTGRRPQCSAISKPSMARVLQQLEWRTRSWTASTLLQLFICLVVSLPSLPLFTLIGLAGGLPSLS